MNVDEFIDGLTAEAGDTARRLLRQAYEQGFREALASAGQPAAPPSPATEQPAPPAPAPIAERVEWVPDPQGGAEKAADGESFESEDEDDESAGETPLLRPILANAMVGTLRRRIIRTFDLERFDIDVVICRSGDPDRRQLKTSARLASYRREEQ